MRPVPRTSITIRIGSEAATPGAPTSRSPTIEQPSIASIAARALAAAASVRDSSARPCTASWRRAASSEASSSELGLVERTSRTARATAAGSTSPPAATWSIADCCRLPTILCVERYDRVGAERQRGLRHAGVEAEVRPPCLVDGERDPGRVRHLGEAADVRRHAVVGRRDDERGAGTRSRPPLLQRRPQCLRRDAVRHAHLVVALGGDERRDPPRQHEPVDHARVRVALHHDRCPRRREREAERVIALRGAVGQEPRLPGAVGVCRQLLRLLVGRRGGADVDPLRVLRHVEQQRTLADRPAQARVGAGAALVAGDVEAGGAAEAVGDERVEVGRRRLAPPAHRPAARSSSARTKPSRSPSSTRLASPISWFVRWSLTIVYGWRT